MRVPIIISHIIYCCCLLLIFLLKQIKCCQNFDTFLKFSKCISNLVKCCQNSAPKVPFYSARNKNRIKSTMLIKNKTDFAKGMDVFLHVI
jgi:hypothetical protein